MIKITNIKIFVAFLLLYYLFSCDKYNLVRTNILDPESINYSPPIPELTTNAATAVASNSAITGGIITSDGGAQIDARGCCWSTNTNPTTALSTKTSDGTGNGTFKSNITGLTANTTYHVRAYASNRYGIAYGNELTFTTPEEVTDFDGNIYNSVSIGTQVWMKENLKVTHYADGTPIDLVEDTATWRALGYTGKAYCWYQNSSNYGQEFGALYTWATATNNVSSFSNPSGIKGVCPDGWHMPSDEEWKQLELFVGLSQTNTESWDIRGTSEGNKLKSTDVWVSGNGNNETGFTALPGGHRILLSSPYQIAFMDMGTYGEWWTSSENTLRGEFAICRELRYLDGAITRLGFHKVNGYSVRCVKD